jgi:hypothetical protein
MGELLSVKQLYDSINGIPNKLRILKTENQIIALPLDPLQYLQIAPKQTLNFL